FRAAARPWGACRPPRPGKASASASGSPTRVASRRKTPAKRRSTGSRAGRREGKERLNAPRDRERREWAGAGADGPVEGRGGTGGAERVRGGVGEVVQGGGRVLQQGEDQGLGEGRAGELAGAAAEAGGTGEGVGGVVEEVVQGGMQFGYTQHGEAPGADSSC